MSDLFLTEWITLIRNCLFKLVSQLISKSEEMIKVRWREQKEEIDINTFNPSSSVPFVGRDRNSKKH